MSLFAYTPVSRGGEQPFTRPADRDRDSASAHLVEYGLPIEPIAADVTLTALRVTAWRESLYVDRLLLEGWVDVSMGEYQFKSERAVAWIHRRPDGERVINEIAIFLDDLGEMGRSSGMQAAGDELLVTATTIGEVRVISDGFREGLPGASELAVRAERRLLSLLTRPPPDEPMQRPLIERPPVRDRLPILDEALGERARPLPSTEVKLPPPDQRIVDRLRAPDAIILFDVDGDIEYRFAGEDESEGVAILRGRLVLQYAELERRPGEPEVRTMTLTADRAVIFTDPISVEDALSGQIEADVVRGVYLEGNVIADDGEYRLRGPRMYYEFRTNRALVLDAVMSTYSSEAQVPVYVRADEIRQIAENEWRAERMRLATSAFYTPHLSVGAGSVTIERRRNDVTGEARTFVDAEDITLRVGETPIFWWPGFEAAADDTPLRNVTVGGSSNKGLILSTEWDLFGLLNITHKPSKDAELLLEYFSERGPAIGIDYTFATEEARGRAFGYLVQDDGTDRTASGAERDISNETRGMLDIWRIEDLGNDWTMILEGSYISDVGFIENFFEDLADERREFQSRAYLRRQEANAAFEIFAKYDFNEFIPNEDLLQTPGYFVEKAPELGYYRYGDALFDGLISYSSEYRYTRARFSFPEHTLAEIGQGRRAFDLPADTFLRDYYLDLGYPESWVNRVHTRQELAMPLHLGGLNIIPFVIARMTGYDDEFDEFPGDDEEVRWYAGGGVRIAARFAGIDNEIESRAFDLHRIRHIVEPSMTVWHGESNAGANVYPTYDYEVEGASIGSAVRAGVRNTWQTQRGGPGRWHSVDFLRLDTDIVLTGGETRDEVEIPRFYDYRPDYSLLGDHAVADLAWLVSDSLAIAGNAIYDLNNSDLARGSIGYRVDHTDDLFSYADIRYFEEADQTLLGLGLGYRLTQKYYFRGTLTYDIDLDQARRIGVGLTRRMPQFDVEFSTSYNEIRNDTTFSVMFIPHGLAGRRYGGGLDDLQDER